MQKSLITRLAAFVVFATIAPVAARANSGTVLPLNQYQAGTETTTLIPNGNFENGTTGFSVGGDATVGAPINPPSPASTVGLLAFQANTGSMSTFSPIMLSPNTQYVVSAYMWNFGGFTTVSVQDNAATLSSSSIQLFSEASGQPQFVYSGPINSADFPNGLKLTATGGPFINSGSGTVAQIDNIAVTPVSQFVPVAPEPTIAGIAATGALLLLRRSRRTRVATE